jgi:hypothetical protein
MIKPREQGTLGELSAMEWFGRAGWNVFFPVTHSSDVDLIVMRGEEVKRVQVKTSRAARGSGFEVTLCTRGGNQSWNGITTMFSSSRCDLLFVLVADGRRWCIPSAAVPGRTKVTLGGPLYDDFEVAPGLPFDAESGRATVARTASAARPPL